MSWWQLYGILQEAVQIKDDLIIARPTSCPLCGTALNTDVNEGLRCPFGDWVEGDTPVEWNA